MATVAVPHIGMHSHLNAAARIGSALAARGHRVIGWAPEWARERVTAGGVEFRPSEPIDLRSVMFSPQSLTAALAECTVDTSAELIEELASLDVDLVVHDFQVLWARVAADFLGIPRVVSYPMYPGSADRMWPFHPLADQVRRVPELMTAIEEAVDRVEACRGKIVRRWGIDIGSWHQALVSRGETTFIPSLEEITGVPEPEAGGIYVGPLLPTAPPRPRRREPPVVFASFGTVFNFDPGIYRAVLAALAREPVEVVISTGRGPVRVEDLGPTPANVTVSEFVDDVPALLARADVFVTHCGTSSLHESLLAGVPMVCLPRAVDQFAWASRVSQLGAGLVCETEPSAVRDAVAQLLEDERFGRNAREVGGRLAAFDGEERIGRLVDEVLTSSGASAS